MSSARRGRIDPAQLAAAYSVDETELAVLKQWAPQATEVIVRAPVASIRPSPFQPKGRPSARAVDAVAAALAASGAPSTLIDESGTRDLARLDAEGRALAELAADIAEHGVETPLEVRRVGDGFELLSGHRRLAAASLAGLDDVPVVDRGAIPDHAAAAIVYRRNLLRKDFTAWQEAVSFSAIQRNRRQAGLPDSVRAVARALGSSHGRAGDLLSIARAFSPELLTALGAGDPEPAEEALARLTFRTLREVATLPSADERLAAAREVTGLGAAAVERTPRSVCEHTPRRGGGFTLTVRTSPERMTADEARTTLAVLERAAEQLRARLGGR
ncbi:MAG: ParB/RepB/Spo0J family partition protein [Gemmatirosa sp.]